MNLGCEFLDRYPDQISGGQNRASPLRAHSRAIRTSFSATSRPRASTSPSRHPSSICCSTFRERRATTYLFISHALGVVSYLCDTMAVMYLGTIVEYGPKTKVLSPPYHPYTEALLSSLSMPRAEPPQNRIRLEGAVPSARDIPSGCRFHTRCPRKVGRICETRHRPGS